VTRNTKVKESVTIFSLICRIVFLARVEEEQIKNWGEGGDREGLVQTNLPPFSN